MKTFIKRIFKIDDLRDLLLVIGVIVAPMTGLRVWKIGPGEVICLLYCILNYKSFRYIPRRDIFIRFWMGFLIASSLGTLWGTLKYPRETFAIDMLTWIYLSVISICTHLVLRHKRKEVITGIMTLVSYGSVIWYYALFLYSRRVSYYFLGAPLWFGGVRFTGGATNPHQIALLLCLCLIVLTWLILNRKAFKLRALNGVLFLINLFLLRQTESSTAIMAVTIGIVGVTWQYIWVHFKNKNALFISMYILISAVVILFGLQIYQAFINWVASDKNGMDRFYIFSSFSTAFFKGPIFGLGPGNHALDGFMEFHNTYLEIVAMSGIIGTLFFVALSYRLLKSSLRSPVSFGVIAASYVYGLAGFGARRLVYWLIISLAYNLANDEKRKQ